MKPEEIKESYDRIASWWQETHRDSPYGLTQLKRALQFAPVKGRSLDVGCGSEGRFMRVLQESGYETEGIDISPKMIALARKQFPASIFYTEDICQWTVPKQYDLISAWDSTFHLPLDQQEPVLKKLCFSLKKDGVILFTCGGGDAARTVTGSFAGQNFAYSTLGIRTFLTLLDTFGCGVTHVEYDQFPENHVTIIAKKL